ncbi:BREX-1 system phosphatase PglZ type A [Moritella yayanosii]|uniref:Uncharacterized protein n=1 Tax=Moritella yayanosii TaxID=69539 RepID=A0A330LMR7_9GAMM|nr:BREX-1 system phosphatase PglZ type A [Moritella yayanosii]SQD78317.1 conserved protein of unknown function, might belong to Alkaline phosphatase [Moritella yayanosii]
MTSRISVALERLFAKHRIVFWYDEKQELRDDFESLALDNIEKLEITNNEFSLKYKVLREFPKQQFLLYKEAKQPEPLQNWLLDVELAHTFFRTDQVAIWLAEMELPNEFTELVELHSAFFGSQANTQKEKSDAEQRKQALKPLLSTDDTLSQVRFKMLAVAAGATQQGDARLDVVLELLFRDLSKGRNSTYQLIEQCKLESFLWQQVANHYGYESDTPSMKDFVFELFKYCYVAELDSGLHGVSADDDSIKSQHLNNNALVFFKRWKDSRLYQSDFETLSAQCETVLNIEADLQNRDLQEILALDYFKVIDQKVIHELVISVAKRTLSQGEVALCCRQRRQGHWYSEFEHLYDAVDVASQFFALLENVQLDMASATEAVQRYTQHWFKLDQLYRKYVYALKVSSQNTLLSTLTEQIENLYINKYLQPLSNSWQQHVDDMDSWQVSDVVPQNKFFSRWVQPYLTKKHKICVIISDAFRYEAGEEMVSRIRQEDRYHAELSHALSSMPSYTQLGMASLLPQDKDMPLQLADNNTATIFMGEQSTQGTDNRDKILKTILGERAGAVQAKSLLEMTQVQSRELLKAHDVLYIYHNRIDHVGDKMQSEGEAFEATEKTFADLLKIIKKLANANANNLLITADHGFIYQNSTLEESDFLSKDVTGEILYNDRRFVLGKGLSCSNALKRFTAKQLGLAGDVEAVIPKGIQRLRLSGSGSRFVHGGASLQEVIVPVIKIKKKRTSDTRMVEVDILRGSSSVITSGQLSVTLYQIEAVTDKTQPRSLRAGMYSETGKLISDRHNVVFDFSAENPRERELKLRFLLNHDADAANNQEVILKLEEAVAGTNLFSEYKTLRYTIRRSFTTDFDF